MRHTTHTHLFPCQVSLLCLSKHHACMHLLWGNRGTFPSSLTSQPCPKFASANVSFPLLRIPSRCFLPLGAVSRSAIETKGQSSSPYKASLFATDWRSHPVLCNDRAGGASGNEEDFFSRFCKEVVEKRLEQFLEGTQRKFTGLRHHLSLVLTFVIVAMLPVPFLLAPCLSLPAWHSERDWRLSTELSCVSEANRKESCWVGGAGVGAAWQEGRVLPLFQHI